MSATPAPKRIVELTDEQRAAIPDHVAKWVEVGRNTDEADWVTFERAAESCYGYAGLPWHGNVVRVSNPLVLSLAAPIAAYVLGTGGHRDVVRGAVGGAVYGAVRGAVDGAVRSAVGGVVDGAVDGAPYTEARRYVLNHYHRRFGGQWWVNWQAWTSYFRDVCGLHLDGDLWARERAYADAQSSAGWWWPGAHFVMVCDRPRALHLERVGPDGWGSHRLHNASGPAITYADGWGLYFWHGVRVEPWVIESPTAERVLSERNVEVRRCAAESLGWDRLKSHLALVAVAPDPGNSPFELELYDLPPGLADVYDEPARILVCVNGSAERDGTRRVYGLPVPAHHDDPVAAAAELYGVPAAVYGALEIRR